MRVAILAFLEMGLLQSCPHIIGKGTNRRNPSFLGNGFTTSKNLQESSRPQICRNPSFLGNGFTTQDKFPAAMALTDVAILAFLEMGLLHTYPEK